MRTQTQTELLLPEPKRRNWSTSVLSHFDLWFFPCVLLTAWFYYPYCQNGPSLCIWKALFHKPCIGCGLTRGVCFLVHGQLHEAVRFNPLSLVLIFALLLAFCKALGECCTVFRAANRQSITREIAGY